MSDQYYGQQGGGYPPPQQQQQHQEYHNYQQQPQYGQQQQQPQYEQQQQQQQQQQYQQSQYQDQQQQQQYAPPPGPPPPQQPPQGGEFSFDEKFKVEKPKYNDLWAGILFIIVFLGFVVVSGLSIQGYSKTKSYQGDGIYDSKANFGLTTNTLVLFMLVLAVAFVMSYAYLWVTRKFTKQIIYISAILNIVLALGTAAYYFYKKYYSSAILFVIFGLFYAFCFWSWRSRIPFSVLMLQTVIDVAKRFGHVFLVSFIGGVVAIAVAAWFSVTLVAIYVRYTPNENNPACKEGGCSNGKVIGLIVYVTFAAFWISELIKNVMHTTVSGVYGVWYFARDGEKVRGATSGAFKRSMTYSFGSIALGSLIASIVQLLKQAASVAQRDAAQSGDIIQYVIFCILSCILSLVQWIIEFVNHYCFSYIALYGDAYFPAAKATWKLIKDRGIDALINDCLIDPVLTAGAVAVAYTCTLLSFLYLQFTKPTYNEDHKFSPIIMAFSFLIGLQVANVFLVPLKSGVSTIFVAAAVDPQVMIDNHPQLYGEMVRVYPHVQQAIHV